MRRVLAAALALVFIVLIVGYLRDGRWLPAVLLLVAGAWPVWSFARPARPPAPSGPVVLTGDLAARAGALLDTGREVEAVKLVRRETGAGLTPAVHAVRALRDHATPGQATGDQDETRPS
jgi:hypothetical protein